MRICFDAEFSFWCWLAGVVNQSKRDVVRNASYSVRHSLLYKYHTQYNCALPVIISVFGFQALKVSRCTKCYYIPNLCAIYAFISATKYVQ